MGSPGSVDPGAGVVATLRGFPAPSGPLDLDLRRGDVVLLRGPNGCGKTSLLRQLAGLDAALRAAEVAVQGADPRTLPAAQLAQRVHAVWATPRASLVGLTVAGEARLRGLPVPDAVATWADRDVATLSSGEARRVALAFAGAHPVTLLLLDEPCTGLDDAGVGAVADLVKAASRTGAVVAADHTGHLAALATRTLDLAPGGSAPWHVTPPHPTGATVLRSTPASVPTGQGPIHLPGAAWGPGLHAVTGRNGAGKSTWLRRLAGLTRGEGVAIQDGMPDPGRNVTFLQADAGDLLLAPTVRDELATAGDPDGFVPSALLDRHPLSLSAGEAQRVALAKALGRDVPVHLLDEPEAHLDGDGRRRLAAAIARRIAAGACVLAATHDAGLAAAASSRTVLP